MSVGDPVCLIWVTQFVRLCQAAQVRQRVGQCKAVGARQLLPDPQNIECWISDQPTVAVSCLTENNLYNRLTVAPATRSIVSLALVNLTIATSRKIPPVIHAVEWDTTRVTHSAQTSASAEWVQFKRTMIRVVTANIIIKMGHCLDSNCVYYHGSYENTFHWYTRAVMIMSLSKLQTIIISLPAHFNSVFISH